jgi:hypothetical protein
MTSEMEDGVSMVERVARAIAATMGTPAGAPVVWEHLPSSVRDYCREQARAAIAAMREPSEAMKRAHPDADTKEACYRAMIDAALADRSGG